MTPARLLSDPPAPGDWNMALDEALLQSAGQSGQTTLRFYGWSAPTLSLGYFQSWRDRGEHSASRECALVRRSTGGGAILHHHELTYSFVAPVQDRLAASIQELYSAFHETLITAINDQFAAAPTVRELRVCGDSCTYDRRSSFLCFERHTCGDVLWGEHKIAGSAQRRHFGAVLQHGSVLLLRSPFAPQLPGLAQCAGREISPHELATCWQTQLAERLQLRFAASEYAESELDKARGLAQDKFSTSDWTRRC
jgi:lipoate-protein ligase A